MSHEYRMEQLRAAIAAARKNFKKDANFFVVGLTYGWRRLWKQTCSETASSSILLKRSRTTAGPSGASAIFGEGNIPHEWKVVLYISMLNNKRMTRTGRIL